MAFVGDGKLSQGGEARRSAVEAGLLPVAGFLAVIIARTHSESLLGPPRPGVLWFGNRSARGHSRGRTGMREKALSDRNDSATRRCARRVRREGPRRGWLRLR